MPSARLAFNVGQQFVSVLLAESTLQFALQDLKGFQQTVDISEAQFKAGDISEGDYLKIKLQLLQFQTDVSSARLAKVQALVGLRELLGLRRGAGRLRCDRRSGLPAAQAKVEDLQAQALRERPDFRAAELGVTAAQSQIHLAKANAKVDVNGTYDFTHIAGENSASIFASFDLPIFNRNQGEIARTRYALTQAQEQQLSASDTVLSDVANAYEAVRSNDEVVQLYTSGYLKQAQDSRDISEYAYKRGRRQPAGFSGRRAQLPGDPTGLSPGPGLVYDGTGTVEASGRNEEPAMRRVERRNTAGSRRGAAVSAIVGHCWLRLPDARDRNAIG